MRTKDGRYESPYIEIMKIEVEQCFAVSDDDEGADAESLWGDLGGW